MIEYETIKGRFTPHTSDLGQGFNSSALHTYSHRLMAHHPAIREATCKQITLCTMAALTTENKIKIKTI